MEQLTCHFYKKALVASRSILRTKKTGDRLSRIQFAPKWPSRRKHAPISIIL